MSSRTLTAAALILAALAPSGGAQSRPSGGNGTIYIGTYDKKILVLDEATLRVRDTPRIRAARPAVCRKSRASSRPRPAAKAARILGRGGHRGSGSAAAVTTAIELDVSP